MKLYRVIPDQLGSADDLQAITEDALYKLGYISISEHMAYFRMVPRMERTYNELYDNGIKGIFFFKNPWDAVMCSWWVDFDFYSKNLVRVCEYDFPDEIIEKSTQGTGLYKGYKAEEVKVPISVLETTGTVLNTPTPELAEEIKEEKKKMLLESAEKYREIDNDYAEEIYEYLKEAYEELHEYNIMNIEFLMKSPFITGKIFTVTSKNRDWENIDIEYLINNSCGILTYENSNGWMDYMEQKHKNIK